VLQCVYDIQPDPLVVRLQELFAISADLADTREGLEEAWGHLITV
jgi:hypothetical protein